MKSELKYPLYRKLKSGMVLYRINSDSQFTELKIQGEYYSLNNYDSKIYTDRLYIDDLIIGSETILEITELEFDWTLKNVCSSKKQIPF